MATDDLDRKNPRQREEQQRPGREERFPARRRLRFIPVVLPEADSPELGGVLEASRRLKAFPLQSTLKLPGTEADSGMLPALSGASTPDSMARALKRLDSRLRHLLELLGSLNTSSETPPDAGTPVPPANAPGPDAEAATGGAASRESRRASLLALARQYYDEWRLLSAEVQPEAGEGSFAEFASSSYMDQLLRHFDLPILVLDSEQRLLRESHRAASQPLLEGLSIGQTLRDRLDLGTEADGPCTLRPGPETELRALAAVLGDGMLLLVDLDP